MSDLSQPYTGQPAESTTSTGTASGYPKGLAGSSVQCQCEAKDQRIAALTTKLADAERVAKHEAGLCEQALEDLKAAQDNRDAKDAEIARLKAENAALMGDPDPVHAGAQAAVAALRQSQGAQDKLQSVLNRAVAAEIQCATLTARAEKAEKAFVETRLAACVVVSGIFGEEFPEDSPWEVRELDRAIDKYAALAAEIGGRG